MNPSFVTVTSLALVCTLIGWPAEAAPTSTDQAFVAQVSQGGMYEVEASELAVQRASTPDTKDWANTEVHDHELVNARLKEIASAQGISVVSDLNSTFRQRLAALKRTSPADFDRAYIEDMREIHDKDEKLFAKEAVDGSGDFKLFAHQTDLIVKRHIGALQAVN
jgi:putative membrane protein